VANLSRFAQPVTLDLSHYAGYQPVEMLGYVSFPEITREPYPLTVAPYSFLWLELQAACPAEELLAEPAAQTPEIAVAEVSLAAPLVTSSWKEFLASADASILQPALRDWLPRKRWFGAKTRTIESLRVHSWVELPPDTGSFTPGSESETPAIQPALFFFEVHYFDGPPDVYQIPLAISTGAALEEIAANRPDSILARFTASTGPAILHDAVARDDFHQGLLRLIAANATLPVSHDGVATPGPVTAAEPSLDTNGESQADTPVAVSPVPLSAQPGEVAALPRTDAPQTQTAGSRRLQPRESPSAGDSAPDGERLDARASTLFTPARAAQHLPSIVGSAEQSNTAIVFGKQLFLKLYRRLQPEENPDVELSRFLTEVAHFSRIPPFLGEISISSGSAGKTTVAMLQGLVDNDGDGWQWFLDRLTSWLSSVAGLPAQAHSNPAGWLSGRVQVSDSLKPIQVTLDAAALLGKRTAEMHLALSSNKSLSAFAPEPLTRDDLERDAQRIEAQIKSSLEALKWKIAKLDDIASDHAGLLLSRRAALMERARSITRVTSAGQGIRIHGDYHLGQTLHIPASDDVLEKSGSDLGDFVVLDFEGEPARPIEERRRKQSPLKDVAGILRSFSYAAFAAIDRSLAAGGDNESSAGPAALLEWAQLWQNAAASAFLSSYGESMADNESLLPLPADAQILLNAYLLEKALYELLYELNNRPAWIRIPIDSILTL
jgi:maltose alpha-D-glucosyltransferase/alpha-amylase